MSKAGTEATTMTRNAVIEKLVNGAVERCRERITAARVGARGNRPGTQAGETGITQSMKQSRGL